MDRAAYLEKVDAEIIRLRANNKRYWYDFGLTKEQRDILVSHFHGALNMEVKPCRSCHGNIFDITIEV